MTEVHGRWFPVSVVLPGEPRPRRRMYVVAADDGLHLFSRPSEDADWHSPIDFDRTELPRTPRQARIGWTVHTADGPVVLTLDQAGGCRCGQMGRWAGPTWSRVEAVRA